MDIRSRYALVTVENTPLDMELAGIGNRMAAFLVDFLLMLLTLGVAFIAVILVGMLSPELSKTLMYIVPFALFFGFHFVQEWLWNGRTFGKRLLGLRVVRDNGQAIGFWEALGRNLMRLIDIYASGAGLFPMLLSKSEKRFGDFLVGTLVVNEQRMARHVRPPARGATPAKRPAQPVSPLPCWSGMLTPEEWELLAAALARLGSLPALRQPAFRQDVTAYFLQRVAWPQDDDVPPDFLERLHESRNR